MKKESNEFQLVKSMESAHSFNFSIKEVVVMRIEEGALIPVTDTLLQWANIVVCMEPEHKIKLRRMLHKIRITETPVLCLDIEDNWYYNDPELVEIINEKLKEFPILEAK